MTLTYEEEVAKEERRMEMRRVNAKKNYHLNIEKRKLQQKAKYQRTKVQKAAYGKTYYELNIKHDPERMLKQRERVNKYYHNVVKHDPILMAKRRAVVKKSHDLQRARRRELRRLRNE